jgi:hypothetical protein
MGGTIGGMGGMGGGDSRNRNDKNGEYDDRSYFPPTDYQQEEREFNGNNERNDIENDIGGEGEEDGPEGDDEDEAYDSLFQGNGPTLSQNV